MLNLALLLMHTTATTTTPTTTRLLLIEQVQTLANVLRLVQVFVELDWEL